MDSWEEDAVRLFKSGHDFAQIAEKNEVSHEHVESVIRTAFNFYVRGVGDAQPTVDDED